MRANLKELREFKEWCEVLPTKEYLEPKTALCYIMNKSKIIHMGYISSSIRFSFIVKLQLLILSMLHCPLLVEKGTMYVEPHSCSYVDS